MRHMLLTKGKWYNPQRFSTAAMWVIKQAGSKEIAQQAEGVFKEAVALDSNCEGSAMNKNNDISQN